MREVRQVVKEKEIPISQQIECVEREINMRRKVYPRLVRERRMTECIAKYEMKCIKAVHATLMNVQTKERDNAGY